MYESPGLSRPSWMDDDEWAEYRMTEEARYELTREDDYSEYDDFYDDYYDAMAEQEDEYLYEEGQEAYYQGVDLYGDEPYAFVEGFNDAKEWDERG